MKRKRSEESKTEEEQVRKKAELQKQRQAAKLSFADDEEDDQDIDEETGRPAPSTVVRMKKDDTVRTGTVHCFCFHTKIVFNLHTLIQKIIPLYNNNK